MEIAVSVKLGADDNYECMAKQCRDESAKCPLREFDEYIECLMAKPCSKVTHKDWKRLCEHGIHLKTK